MGKGQKAYIVLSTLIFFWSVVVLCVLLAGCPQPLPPPIPGPSPVSSDSGLPDPFKNGRFDCHSPTVAAEYTAALSGVRDCLFAPPLACLVSLLPTYNISTVACLVRDLGAAANSAVLAGTASGTDGMVAADARVFINSEDLGFQ